MTQCNMRTTALQVSNPGLNENLWIDFAQSGLKNLTFHLKVAQCN